MTEASAQFESLSKVGIATKDAPHRRLLDSAAVQIGLQAVHLDLDQRMPSHAELMGLELIVAERAVAERMQKLLRSLERPDDPYRPAILLIVPQSDAIGDEHGETSFDGMLPLPQSPAHVAAQLSIALYTHRAFARRYDDAMEELRLNRQIFHSVTSGISVASNTGDLPLVYVNPSFEVMTGYTLEDVVGMNCRFLQGKDRDQPGLTLVREAIREGRQTLVTLRNYRKDGTPFWNELAMSPIRGRDGRITHFVGVQTDVTARVDFENALRESEKLAVVGRLAASIAHEINNPLESVTNLIYLAERAATFEESRHYLAQVDQELRRVKLITSQSLRFYKQSSNATVVHLDELLDSVLDIQKSRILSARVQVERRDRQHRSIVCMESEIRQVLNNLIGNATDAMKSTGGRLLVRTTEGTLWSSGAKGVFVTVADSGEGIAAPALRSLFQAFYTTKGTKGTGLGLWISNGIVQRHHGKLQVRSRYGGPGSGTTFRLFLPFQGVASESAAIPEPALPAVSSRS